MPQIDHHEDLATQVNQSSDLPGSLAAIEGSDAAVSFPAGDMEGLVAALTAASQDESRAAAAIEEAADVRRERQWDREGFVAFYESLLRDDR